MFFRAAVFVLFAVSAAGGLFAQVKATDFTRANATLNKRYDGKESDAFKKSFQGSDMRYKSFKNENADKAWGGASQLASVNGQKSAFSNESFYGSDKKYSVPEFSQYSQTSRYNGVPEDFVMDNAERNMSKKYEGSFDTEKRSRFHNKIRADYNDHIERSMSDINKYYSRKPTDDESGIAIKKAGADLNQKDESILDLFDISGTHIKRDRLKIALPRAMSSKPIDEDGNFIEAPKTPVRPKTTDLPKLEKLPVQQSNTGGGNVYGSDASITLRRGQSKEMETDFKFNSLGVPKEMQGGRTVIKVQVKK